MSEEIKRYLKLVEARGIISAHQGGIELSINDERIDLGKTPEDIADKLKTVADFDLDDLFGSSSMDFASEEGFENDDAAHELFDKAVALMVPKPDETARDKVEEESDEDYEYENDLAMEFVKLPLASMSKEEIRSEMSGIFKTLYAMGMGDEPQTDAGVAMEELATSVEDSGGYFNDDWVYPSTNHYPDYHDEISDEDLQTMIVHQQKVKDVIGHSSLDQEPAEIGEGPEMEELNDIRKRAGLPIKEEDDDDFVYASEIVFFDKDGKEIGYMDFDGYEDANTDHSEQELQAIAQKYNISSEDGKVVGYYDASEDEIDFSDPHNDETYPEGTIGVYIDSQNPMGKVKEIEEGCGDDSCPTCGGSEEMGPPEAEEQESHKYEKHHSTNTGSVSVEASADSIDELKVLLQKVGITLPSGEPGHDMSHDPEDDAEGPMKVISLSPEPEMDGEKPTMDFPKTDVDPDAKEVLTNILKDKLKDYLRNGK